ncbi:MAG TPA: DUF177 domain-containing protein [Desulfobacteria bacterium]|nr:DUF177 domain-containing protein [Desulfobacteria bacterium]
MLINVAKVRKTFGASETFEFQEKLAPLDIGGELLEFTGPVEVVVKVTNLGNALLITGVIHSRVKCDCSRCLETIILPADGEFEQEMCYVSELQSYLSDHPEAEEDENYLVLNTDTVDLTEMVREQIVLATPMKPLCSETCQGLCPKCGKNLNLGACGCNVQEIDPRLADLAKLLKSDS